MSRQVQVFGSQPDAFFAEEVFAACPVQPIVVVSLEAKCNGEVLEAVLITCKGLSYDMEKTSKGKHARFVVDLSGSRAAIDASIDLKDLRATGVHVGHFSPSEALLYATERMPESLTDQKRKDEIARTVVKTFDGRVFTLQNVCKAIRKGPPGDLTFIDATIEREQRSEEEKARIGWQRFCHSLSDKLGTDFEDAALKAVAELLFAGPQSLIDIVEILLRKSTNVPLDARDIGLFNADAGYHPLAIDPFVTKVSLSGKAIESALRQKYLHITKVLGQY
jgi:hypothetical protein